MPTVRSDPRRRCRSSQTPSPALSDFEAIGAVRADATQSWFSCVVCARARDECDTAKIKIARNNLLIRGQSLCVSGPVATARCALRQFATLPRRRSAGGRDQRDQRDASSTVWIGSGTFESTSTPASCSKRSIVTRYVSQGSESIPGALGMRTAACGVSLRISVGPSPS